MIFHIKTFKKYKQKETKKKKKNQDKLLYIRYLCY